MPRRSRDAGSEEEGDGPSLGAAVAEKAFGSAGTKRTRDRHFEEEEPTDDGDSGAEGEPGERPVKGKKRGNHAPAEMSSRKPVGRFRQVIEISKHSSRDPRFDPTAGHLDADRFRKAYSFLSEYKDSEIEELKKGLKKKGGDAEEKERMQAMLTQMSMQRAEERKAVKLSEAHKARRASEKESVAAGKAPYFPKKRELKELELIQQFKALEAKGDDAVSKALAKRRKKMQSSDRRKLPKNFGK